MKFKHFYIQESKDLEKELEKKGKIIGKNIKNNTPIFLVKDGVFLKDVGDYQYRNFGDLKTLLKHLKNSSFTRKFYQLDKEYQK